MVEIIFYILSISLQLGGAILGISSISTKRESVLRKFFKNRFSTMDGNTKEIYYDEDVYIDTWKSTYDNKFAFIYLTVGYCLSPLSEINKNINRIVILLLIVSVTIVLIIIEKTILKAFLNTEKIKKRVTISELEQYNLDIDMKSISDEEIKKCLDDSIYEK